MPTSELCPPEALNTLHTMLPGSGFLSSRQASLLEVLQVVYTRGPLLWQGFTVLGNALNKRKLASRSSAPSQEYNPVDRSVINRATILGSVAVEAAGSYEPLVSGDFFSSCSPSVYQMYVQISMWIMSPRHLGIYAPKLSAIFIP